MQKLRIQNKYDKDAKKFTNELELKDSDKIISGKLKISSKQKDKWINKVVPFIAFKSQLSQSEINTIKSGEFEAEFGLGVNEFEADGKTITYLQVIINKVANKGIDAHNEAKGNGYQPQDSFSSNNEEDSIPF